MNRDNQYIAFRRFNFKALCGDTYQIPRGTKVTSRNGQIIAPNGQPVCNIHSERGQQFFAWDGDGQGLLRGDLTYAIAHAVRPHREGFRFNETEQDELREKYGDLLQKGAGLIFNDYFYHLPIGALTDIADRFHISKEELSLTLYEN